MTVIIKVDPARPDEDALERAAEVIRRGGLVAFPTETVYGLGASALNPRAALKIFEAKGRPPDNPLIIHISDMSMLDVVAKDVPEAAFRLARRFWPGPLTLILKRSPQVPPEVTGGLDTVAVRMPAHPVALGLISKSGVPIAAPSANVSGRPSPTRAEHVIRDLYSKVDMIIDAGETLYGIESTIVDVLRNPPVLLRPGAFPVELIEEELGVKIEVPSFARGLGEAERALAPGTKYRHYAPSTPLVLVESGSYSSSADLARLTERVAGLVRELGAVGTVCVVASSETAPAYERLAARVFVVGSRANPFEVAKRLFDVLRRLDDEGCSVAIAEGFEERGLGLAIMNRLRKASVKRVLA